MVCLNIVFLRSEQWHRLPPFHHPNTGHSDPHPRTPSCPSSFRMTVNAISNIYNESIIIISVFPRCPNISEGSDLHYFTSSDPGARNAKADFCISLGKMYCIYTGRENLTSLSGYSVVTRSPIEPSRKWRYSRNGVERGHLVAVMGSTWQLRDVRG